MKDWTRTSPLAALKCNGRPAAGAAERSSSRTLVEYKLPSSRAADPLRGLAEQGRTLRREPHRGEEMVDTVAGKRLVNGRHEGTGVVETAGQRQAIGGDRLNVCMGVRAGGGFGAPIGRFFELAEAHQRHGAGAEHGEEKRVERAQMTRVVGEPDGRARIAALRMNEGQRVMTEGEIRAQVDR